MNAWSTDLKYALRTLRNSPAFALLAIATLALGIGANLAIFSLVDEIWLRPMPVPRADRLLRIFTSNPSSEGVVAEGFNSYPDFESIRQSTRTLSGVAALERRGAQLDTGRESRLLSAAVLSDNFFDVLAPTAAAGRLFTEAEVRAPGALTVVLSYPFWKQQFAADPTLPGRTIMLDRQAVRVAGILPRGFRGTEPTMVPDVWIPIQTWITLTGDRRRIQARAHRDYELFGRRAAGVPVTAVNAELSAIASELGRQFPDTNAGRRMVALPESRTRGAEVRRLSVALIGVAALVLAIACANVASLLLARTEYRRHELAMRVALGASRFRLVRQLVAETALLAGAAALAAIGLGSLLIDLLPRLLPALQFTSQIDAHMSVRGLVFAAAAGLVALVVIGLVPAWQASGEPPLHAVKQQTVSSGSARAAARSVLVVGQVAVSLVLAVSGGLLVKSLLRAEDANPGFDAHQQMVVVELVPGFATEDSAGQRAFVEEARRRLEAIPGVAGTAAGMRIPFGLSGSAATQKVFFPPGPDAPPAEGVPIRFDPVSDRFFELLGTRLLSGRGVERRDLDTGARVLVINRTMARRFFAGRNPVGQRVRLETPDSPPWEIVGVAEDSVNADIAEDPTPYLYRPMNAGEYGELTIAVKTRADASRSADAVRAAIRDVNRDVPIIYLATLREHMRLATVGQRMATGLIVCLGAIGLALLAVGLYGLTSYLVGRRTRELGIRIALGARSPSILRMVVGQALFRTAIGLAAGAFAATLATRALTSFLYGVEPGDPLAYAVGIAVLVAVTCAAALLPARRAMRVDPLTALRWE